MDNQFTKNGYYIKYDKDLIDRKKLLEKIKK